MEPLFYTFAFLYGICVGSFLNVLIYRIPRRMKIALERSICPHCERQLHWYHNIPLLSFLVLRGKCGFCRQPISWRYPLVEAINGVFYVYLYWMLGLSVELFVFAFLASSLLAVFLIDLDFQIIPDVITVPGIILGLGVSLVPGGLGITTSLIGAVVGGGSLLLIAMLGDWLFRKESMGGGDIKLAAMLGAFLGWQKVILVFIGGAAIGLVASIILMIFVPGLRQQRVVPFGPFLATAAVVAMLYGDRIINFYVENFLRIN
jgi:leader peptidase (prepilin peptidase) / N-methyltransferase